MWHQSWESGRGEAWAGGRSAGIFGYTSGSWEMKEAMREFSVVSKVGFWEVGSAGSEGGGALGWAGLVTVSSNNPTRRMPTRM